MAGVSGVIKTDNSEDLESGVAWDLYCLLYGLQNRGQASTKIITQMKNPSNEVYFYDGGIKYTPLRNIRSEDFIYAEKKGNGIVREVFDNKTLLDLYGEAGIGGVSNENIYKSNSLPYRFKMIAVGKDGWIENHLDIKEYLVQKDVPFKKETSEVEAFSKLFHYHYRRYASGKEAMKLCATGGHSAPKIKGNYSALALTPKSIVAVCNGKPIGYLIRDSRVYFASESAGAWSISEEINASNFEENWVDLNPGDIVEIFRDGKTNNVGLDSYLYRDSPDKTRNYESFETDKKVCSFEWAYFARPDSVIYNKEVGLVRKQIGKLLAPKVIKTIQEHGGDIDNCIVVPVLASGNWYAVGLCEETKMTFLPALYKNKYALKSFILDYQEARTREVLMKHIPSVNLLKGKEPILTDDSIVRGTTMRVIVDLVRAKAKPNKVHVVAGFPEKRYACINSPEGRKSLIARDFPLEKIRERIHADSLTYGEHQMWLDVLGKDYCYSCEFRKHENNEK
ncbi:MAG: hypothetical protein GF364_19150 [Candidatus Lokiarchaeota archaeon]|nr:hypothetical protein [Candidatus Lokiarchaeota archaeon]